MIEFLFYATVGLGCLIAMHDWRAGVYAGIILDVLRDPVRKITEGHSLAITLAGAVIWGVVVLKAFQANRASVEDLLRRYPHLRQAVGCVAAAIIPAAAVSCLLYSRGFLLAAVGGLSYLGPLMGIAIGFAFARSEIDVYRLMSVYSITSSIALIGVPLEYLDLNIPGLGGIKMEWIRHRQGYTVDLISGFYRSPDIMGLHAAHVIMFSSLLFLRKRRAAGSGWLAAAGWAAACVILSGRRKMIGIPLVFIASYLALGMWRGVRSIRRLVGMAAVGSLGAAAMFIMLLDPAETRDHTEYASTVFTESHSRLNDLVLGSTINTLQRVGIVGAGLGTATLGRRYLGVQTARAAGWQEDGVSRLFVEFGVPGVLLLVLAGVLVIKTMTQAIKSVAPWSSVQVLQIGLLSVVLGDAASYVVSHQQFSGDLVNGLLATILAGMVLGLPSVFAHQQAIESARRRELMALRASPSSSRDQSRNPEATNLPRSL